MFIEQPPLLYRIFYPNAVWRIIKPESKTIFLTFDDGPIPEVTPWVLDVLKSSGVKATFFCVGENVRKYPEIYQNILTEGHKTGNHTFNHLQGWKNTPRFFLNNTRKAEKLIHSRLFRPPHGHMTFPQPFFLQKAGYKIIMWDVVTRDYSKFVSPEKTFENVKRYTRSGSIIVFHDSLKAEKNLRYALPRSIEWLLAQGYNFEVIP